MQITDLNLRIPYAKCAVVSILLAASARSAQKPQRPICQKRGRGALQSLLVPRMSDAG